MSFHDKSIYSKRRIDVIICHYSIKRTALIRKIKYLVVRSREYMSGSSYMPTCGLLFHLANTIHIQHDVLVDYHHLITHNLFRVMI